MTSVVLCHEKYTWLQNCVYLLPVYLNIKVQNILQTSVLLYHWFNADILSNGKQIYGAIPCTMYLHIIIQITDIERAIFAC